MGVLAQPGDRSILHLMALAAMLCAHPLAAASPLEDTTMGGAVFTGPAHPDASAVFLNPGAMGLATQGWHLYTSGSVRLDRVHIERQRIIDRTLPPEPMPATQVLTTSPGGMVAFVSSGSSAAVGLAVGLPLTEDFLIPTADDRSLGYHVLGGHHRQWAGTLAGALKIDRRLHVGFGLWLAQTSFELGFLRDTVLEAGTVDTASCPSRDPCGIENLDAAEEYRVTTASPSLLATQNVALSVGAVYQVANGWWVGLAYHSPSGFQSPLKLTGEVRVTEAPRDAANPAAPQSTTGRAEVSYTLPQSVSVGLRGPLLRDYELVAGARWQALAQQRVFDIRMLGRELSKIAPEWYPRYRGLDDVYMVEVGLEGREGRRARLGGRIRVETGATTPEALSPLTIAGLSITGVAGGQVRLTDSLALSMSYGLSWFPTHTVAADDSLFDPRDRLTCIESGFDVTECGGAAEGRAIPSAAGIYGRISHAMRVTLRYSSL